MTAKLTIKDLINLDCPFKENTTNLVLAVAKLLNQTPIFEKNDYEANFYFKIKNNNILTINSFQSEWSSDLINHLELSLFLDENDDCEALYHYSDVDRRDGELADFIKSKLENVLKKFDLIN